ncbi:uncharacterized protein LOC100678932 isoform X2 [Nasonia vitripennis]|uniref:DDE Tnp4 domain-containing protein n=1 Tax=Nasonia vitripennis TaxID=7425 RepID=A0A7M7GLK4_NASVI|nr:uncharacterized protein LOC100678932 isoform X2 [Nasonia vitripennis]
MNMEHFLSAKLVKLSRRKPLIADFRLAVVLHYLAHGGCVNNEAWLFRLGRSTAYQLIAEVCEILSVALVKKYVQFPNKQQWLQIAKGYQRLWNFPNCIGALYGKHVETEKPAHAGAAFKNYKKFHSLLLIATCDHLKRFTWFSFGDYGSFSDPSSFGTTDLSMKLQNQTANIPPPRVLPNSNIQTTFVFVADEIFGIRNKGRKNL